MCGRLWVGKENFASGITALATNRHRNPSSNLVIDLPTEGDETAAGCARGNGIDLPGLAL
jgi:hypothetical protein